MSNLQAPTNDPTFAERVILFARKGIAAHAVVADPSQRRRAQLLNAVALLLTLLFAIGLIFQYNALKNFLFMPAISIVAFMLGKSKYPHIGVFLFSLGALSVEYLSLYFGYVNNYSLTVVSIVPAALIVTSAIASQRAFTGLAFLAVLAAYFAPLYSSPRIITDDYAFIGSVVLSVGVILYGINVMRANLENSYLGEIRARDNEIQDIKTHYTKRADEYSMEIASANQQGMDRATRLRVIAELSQEIASGVAKKPQEWLTSITQVISEKLGYYHVGIFLLDKKRQYAELRAANSKGGQRMLERRHQLKVGGTGIVGYVTQSGYPRIALSTGTDAVFFNNPDLPETKSEMALPLKIGNEVIGALDAQSVFPSAFSEEDAHTFTALANLIALVIQDMPSGDKNEKAFFSKTEKQRGEYTLGKDKQSGYSFLADGTILSATAARTPAVEKALASGEAVVLPASKDSPSTLAVPVKVRDNVIGYIHIEAGGENRKWSEDEIAIAQSVSERAALALENARLFEETERRAEQEQLMAQVTSRIGESTNFERILQTTIQEIGRTLGAKRTFIQLEPPAPTSSDEDVVEMDQGV
ncbi:MAG: GAF domain-containing protein [Anaerolineales bacterium]|nr:GAF domain-containing protein [Anaerolineales bacterium]